jgi:cytochrome c-type biogenesis protein CcmH/NrfG
VYWSAVCSAAVIIGVSVFPQASATVVQPTMGQAVAAMRAGEWRHAAGLLSQLASNEPHNAEVWRALGNADLQMGRFAASIIAFENGLRYSPDSPQLLFRIAEAYAGMHATDKALA